MKIEDLQLRKQKRKAVGIRLPLEEYEKIKKIAKKEEVSVSEVCSALVRKTIKELTN